MKRTIFTAATVLLLAGCGAASHTSPTAPQPARTQKTTAAGVPLIPATEILVPPNSSRVSLPAERKLEGPIPSKLTLSESRIPSIDEEGLQRIGEEEGYSRCAYWDPFGGVWTVGFGQTHLPGGGNVYGGFCFASYQAALNNLSTSVVRDYQWSVDEACGSACGQHQVNALDDFDYNLGAYIFRDNRGLFDDIHRGAFYSACSIMRGYDIAGGQVLSDLARRRGNECREIERAVVKPKAETAAQRRAKVLRELHGHEYVLGSYKPARGLRGQLAHLRIKLNVHGCAYRRHHHQKLGPKCDGWYAAGARVSRHGRQEDAMIARLKRALR